MQEFCSDANFTHEKINELIHSRRLKTKKVRKSLKRTKFDSENYFEYKFSSDKEDGMLD